MIVGCGYSFIFPSDRLPPHPFSQTLKSVESTKTGLLRSTMRQIRLIVHGHRVDMHSTSLDLLRNLDASLQVLGEDCRRQTILGVIRNLDGFLITLDDV